MKSSLDLNDSVSVLGTDMTVIRIALEEANGKRDKITIHMDSLTVIKMQKFK